MKLLALHQQCDATASSSKICESGRGAAGPLAGGEGADDPSPPRIPTTKRIRMGTSGGDSARDASWSEAPRPPSVAQATHQQLLAVQELRQPERHPWPDVHEDETDTDDDHIRHRAGEDLVERHVLG